MAVGHAASTAEAAGLALSGRRGAGARACSNGDANGKKKPAGEEAGEEAAAFAGPHQTQRATFGISTSRDGRRVPGGRAREEAQGAETEEGEGAPDQAPKRQKASASKPTGKPVEVIDVDAPSIPKKKTSKPTKQATMTSFFGSKKPKEDENGSTFPGWGKKPEEEDDPTLDDLRAKARAAQENTANDEAIARSLEEEDRYMTREFGCLSMLL